MNYEIILSLLSITVAGYAAWNGRKTKVDVVEKYTRINSELMEQIEKWAEQVDQRDKMIAALRQDIAERDLMIVQLTNWAKRLIHEARESGLELTEKLERRT